MKYISTRKDNHEYSFTEAFLNSYTDDEGLFCPKDVPVISKETMLKWSVWKVILHNWIEVKFLWSFSGYLIHIYWRRWCTHRRIGNDSENVVWKLSSTWVGYCTWIHTLFTVDEVSRSYELCGEFYGPTYHVKDFSMQFIGQFLKYLVRKDEEHDQVVFSR